MGGDVGQFVTVTADGVQLLLAPSDPWVERTMGGGCISLLTCLSFLKEALGLGLEDGHSAAQYSPRFQKVKFRCTWPRRLLSVHDLASLFPPSA
jgi:hypothetical protein